MAAYTRQSSFADGSTINASLFNNEYDALAAAFVNTSGHKHDGTTGEGPVIGLIGDASVATPLNKVLIDSSNDHIEFYVDVSSSAVQQAYIADGVIAPVTDSDVDLGTSSLYFKNAYIDAITTTGNVAVGGNLTVTGTTTFNGGTINLGDAATDNVAFNGTITTNLIFEGSTADAHETTLAPGNPSGDITLTLPSSATDTLVGRATTDTLTNKTLTSPKINENVVVTSTATELNLLDGVTATTAELNILDGVTSTASELNILDGVTSTAAELNTLDGITAVVGELNALDLGSTAVGTAIASKAVILDSNKDYTGIRNLTVTGELDGASLDIEGDADINGTLEADAITIDDVALNEYIADTVGAMVTSSNTETNITVTYEDSDNTLDFAVSSVASAALATESTITANNSTDETVYPVFVDGATGSQGLESDTGLSYNPSTGLLTTTELSATTLDIGGTNITATAAELNIMDGVTSTAAELNILDGVTSTAAELNILDGVTSTAAELNILDGVTSTAAELNILDGVTASATDINLIDGITNGTVIASKAIITDSNKDITGGRNITISGELDAATLDISGNTDIDGDIDVDGTTNLDNTDIDGTLTVDGTAIDFNATSTLAIDNTNTSNGITIGTSTSGVPISIGHSTSETTINDNLTVTGNFTVSGTSTTVDSTTVAVADSMFKLAKDQGTSADALDFGFYGQYGVGGTAKYAGVFRDLSVSGDPFTFFDSLEAEPGTTVNTGGTGYDLADISAGGATFADSVTITGDLTVSGDDITMGTNTSGHIMVADGTNFNPVAVSGDVTIASNGAITIANDAVEQAMIADDAVGADQLASNAVVNASVASSAAIAFSKMADLTASRALVSDGSGDVSAASVTSTELGYVSGVTAAIQDQVDSKAGAGFALAMAVAL